MARNFKKMFKKIIRKYFFTIFLFIFYHLTSASYVDRWFSPKATQNDDSLNNYIVILIKFLQ